MLNSRLRGNDDLPVAVRLKGCAMTKQVQEAYIAAAMRTPVGKAPRGVFRNTQ